MKIVESFPREVGEYENVWITMSDGCRLAARIWLPEDAEHDPVPAILEYIPYRKRDLTAERDVQHHPYVAGFGYACVRVDMRGSGESEGVLTDEYLPLELADGLAVIAWIAAQPWCTGDVGMIGISWGGFNGLQIAALQPPALKAVITLCSTDDRYADDVHYMGGCHLTDNLSWASTMFAHNASPPDPVLVGDHWREMWMQRLEDSGLWLETWLRHQHRDDYWKHGSVCEDIEAIRCPVMAVSGWADGYSNAVLRLLATLKVPRKGLIGPWAHLYPHVGLPGPAIGFLQETLRWWDHWLKHFDNGIMDEPMLRAWMLEPAPPAAWHAVRAGRWVSEPAWPSPRRIRSRSYRLAPGALLAGDGEVPASVLGLRSPLGTGLYAGKWCAYGIPPDYPSDQRPDDCGSLVFDTAPLEADVEILGAPSVALAVEADQPVAMIAVRLNDVSPDDTVARVTYGLLNLTHRDGHDRPRPLVPGLRYPVTVQMNDVGYRFRAGHRIRLAMSTSYWPLAWPPPLPVRLTLDTGNSTLTLPIRPPNPQDAGLREFDPPEAAPPLDKTWFRNARHERRVSHDLATGETVLEIVNDEGCYRLDDIDLEIETCATEHFRHRETDWESASGETVWTRRFARNGWDVRTQTWTLLRGHDSRYRIHARLEAFENGKRVYCREWEVDIPRELG